MESVCSLYSNSQYPYTKSQFSRQNLVITKMIGCHGCDLYTHRECIGHEENILILNFEPLEITVPIFCNIHFNTASFYVRFKSIYIFHCERPKRTHQHLVCVIYPCVHVSRIILNCQLKTFENRE